MAVWDIVASAPVADLMGGTFREGGLNHTGDFRWAQWDLPGGRLEMIEPVDTDDADHFLVRFLSSRGEGVHHVTVKVTDIEAAMGAATAAGFEVVSVDLRYPFWREAFVSPKSTSGVLIQLAEWEDAPPPGDVTLAEALGR